MRFVLCLPSHATAVEVDMKVTLVSSIFTPLIFQNNLKLLILSVGGIVVSIVAFQAVDLGSILGHRNLFHLIMILDVCVALDQRIKFQPNK